MSCFRLRLVEHSKRKGLEGLTSKRHHNPDFFRRVPTPPTQPGCPFEELFKGRVNGRNPRVFSIKGTTPALV